MKVSVKVGGALSPALKVGGAAAPSATPVPTPMNEDFKQLAYLHLWEPSMLVVFSEICRYFSDFFSLAMLGLHSPALGCTF